MHTPFLTLFDSQSLTYTLCTYTIGKKMVPTADQLCIRIDTYAVGQSLTNIKHNYFLSFAIFIRFAYDFVYAFFGC